jgi:hypothetical protein
MVVETVSFLFSIFTYWAPPAVIFIVDTVVGMGHHDLAAKDLELAKQLAPGLKVIDERS